MVLENKGLSTQARKRIRRYYEDSITLPIINNIPGKKVKNKRLTLRQGDCPSSKRFGYGIDPLLIYLERRLSGTPIYAHPPLAQTQETKIKKTPHLNNSRNLWIL